MRAHARTHRPANDVLDLEGLLDLLDVQERVDRAAQKEKYPQAKGVLTGMLRPAMLVDHPVSATQYRVVDAGFTIEKP